MLMGQQHWGKAMTIAGSGGLEEALEKEGSWNQTVCLGLFSSLLPQRRLGEAAKERRPA